jgi:hypothetical protein
MRLDANDSIGTIDIATEGLDKGDNNNYSFSLSVSLVNYKLKAGNEVKRNPNKNGVNLLIHYGIALQNNDRNDCYLLTLAFSNRKDDSLIQHRIKFFSKYEMFDSIHEDLIDECIKPNNPFSRRILFFYYTQMLDQIDFSMEEPKRDFIEQDRIVIHFIKENLEALDTLSSTTIKEEEDKLSKETNQLKKVFIIYKIQQKRLLRRLIEKYSDQYLFLLKDETL